MTAGETCVANIGNGNTDEGIVRPRPFDDQLGEEAQETARPGADEKNATEPWSFEPRGNHQNTRQPQALRAKTEPTHRAHEADQCRVIVALESQGNGAFSIRPWVGANKEQQAEISEQGKERSDAEELISRAHTPAVVDTPQ